MRVLFTVVCITLFNVLPRPYHPVSSFRYERTVSVPLAMRSATACTTLDAAVYAHAAPALKDVRLFRAYGPRDVETPYAITLSESDEAESEPATVLNLGQRAGEVVFDLAMPPRPYTDVLLDLDARNFIAAAEVSGSSGDGPPTHLGTFTLFDLSQQHLGRGTSLPLQESGFPTLHIALRFSPAPGTSGKPPTMAVVRGATVPPSREAQTLYTVVAGTSDTVQQGHETVARLSLPAHVPVERVSIVPSPEFSGNFSRDVLVTAHTIANEEDERLTGLVERVVMERGGGEIRKEQLGFAATLGANLQTDAAVEVRIQNGDDLPLPLRSVRLEMRERRLCFPVEPHAETATYLLMYGDPALHAPRYDFARTFSPSTLPAAARLSAESPNPSYAAEPAQQRSVMERHPELLWVALLVVVCILAVVAIHSAKRMAR